MSLSDVRVKITLIIVSFEYSIYIIHSENYDELNFRISVGRKEKMRTFLAIAKLELM